jgi:hypothetical protein
VNVDRIVNGDRRNESGVNERKRAEEKKERRMASQWAEEADGFVSTVKWLQSREATEKSKPEQQRPSSATNWGRLKTVI